MRKMHYWQPNASSFGRKKGPMATSHGSIHQTAARFFFTMVSSLPKLLRKVDITREGMFRVA